MADRRPGAVPQRHRADHGRHAHRAHRRRRAGRRRPDRRGRHRPVGARRRRRDRRDRRHRDARHDRHPPAHVADRDARLRRRLDPDPVLRLVLPRARQALPPRGHPRRQPALGAGRRSRPASPPPSTGRTACRPSTTPTPRSTRCEAVPGRFVLAYGNIQQAPVGVDRRPGGARPSSTGDARTTTCSASRSPSTSPATRPSRRGAAFEVARELGLAVTTHAGVWGATNDDGIRLMHENGFMTPDEHLRARGDADRRLLPPHRRHRRLGLGVDRVRAERRPGLPAHLAGAPPRHPGLAVDGHQRVVERRPVLRDAHDARRRPLARAPRGAREGRHRHPLLTCAPSRSSTGPPAAAPGPRPRRPRPARRPARRPTSC